MLKVDLIAHTPEPGAGGGRCGQAVLFPGGGWSG